MAKGKDRIFGYCNCPEKVYHKKKTAGSTFLVCSNCDFTLGVVAKKNQHYSDFYDYVTSHKRKEIERYFVTDPEKLKQALEIKSYQEENAYKKKLGMWN